MSDGTQFVPVNGSIWAYEIPDDPFPREMLNKRDVAWHDEDRVGVAFWAKIEAAFRPSVMQPRPFQPPDRAGGSLSEDDAA